MNYLKKKKISNPTRLSKVKKCYWTAAGAAVLCLCCATPAMAAGSDPLYRRAVRVSMGTVFQVPWTYLPADTDWQETLHALGFCTAAMALRDDSLRIDDARLRTLPRLAIVLGTEGDGLAGSTIAACDYTVRIPMTHGVDSLNVAAASAVAFYQLALLRG
jgi:tRNA G18 (ribose-2'-O)-methylase SpoU